MNTTAQRLLDILQLERIEKNLFRGRNESETQSRLFGGQVLAQALRAAYATVEERQVHSLHGYFLRAGNSEKHVLYEVDRIRDGRSFVTRRVVAIQSGAAIFSMSVSFHGEEPGFEHAHMMPNVPPPEELADDLELARALHVDDPHLSPAATFVRPFETRSVFPIGSEAWRDDRRWNPVWLRFRLPQPDMDPTLANCLLAYASDMGLVSSAALPHQSQAPRSGLQMASLDHALWLHRPVPIGDWLLYHKRSTRAQGGLGLNHGDFFSKDGALIASVSQEGLLRRRSEL
jgi:acyl-CoA thioesterase-2